MRDNDEIHLKPAALIGLMLALFGGNVALTTEWTKPETVRPDPFTGTEGRMLEKRIDALEHRIDAIRSDLNLCLARMHEPER